MVTFGTIMTALKQPDPTLPTESNEDPWLYLYRPCLWNNPHGSMADIGSERDKHRHQGLESYFTLTESTASDTRKAADIVGGHVLWAALAILEDSRCDQVLAPPPTPPEQTKAARARLNYMKKNLKKLDGGIENCREAFASYGESPIHQAQQECEFCPYYVGTRNSASLCPFCRAIQALEEAREIYANTAAGTEEALSDPHQRMRRRTSKRNRYWGHVFELLRNANPAWSTRRIADVVMSSNTDFLVAPCPDFVASWEGIEDALELRLNKLAHDAKNAQHMRRQE